MCRSAWRSSHRGGCTCSPRRPAPSGATPILVDETIEPLNVNDIEPGDVVGIGIHSGNALRGYEVGRQARARGAWVVFGRHSRNAVFQ